jgi:hypothetical protein
MHRKVGVWAVVVVLVSSGAVVGGMVQAASGETTTIRVCEQLTTEFAREIDARKEGFSAGDSFVYANRLLDPQTGTRRGRIVGSGGGREAVSQAAGRRLHRQLHPPLGQGNG